MGGFPKVTRLAHDHLPMYSCSWRSNVNPSEQLRSGHWSRGTCHLWLLFTVRNGRLSDRRSRSSCDSMHGESLQTYSCCHLDFCEHLPVNTVAQNEQFRIDSSITCTLVFAMSFLKVSYHVFVSKFRICKALLPLFSTA